MGKRLTRIEPWQTAKTVAALYFIVGLVLAVPLALCTRMFPEVFGHYGTGFFLALPFIYGLGSLIVVPIACWFYNLIARWTGGVEVVLEDTPPS